MDQCLITLFLDYRLVLWPDESKVPPSTSIVSSENADNNEGGLCTLQCSTFNELSFFLAGISGSF